MTRVLFSLLTFVCCGFLASSANAQPAAPSEAAQLVTLGKKIDEQNVKIDALSQQILKLQQELALGKTTAPSNMVGVANAEETATAAPVAVATGNSHVVTHGETLTSIAKRYKVGIDDLRKLNHIEDDRKLQAGQTLAIPNATTPAASPAVSP